MREEANGQCTTMPEKVSGHHERTNAYTAEACGHSTYCDGITLMTAGRTSSTLLDFRHFCLRNTPYHYEAIPPCSSSNENNFDSRTN